MIADVLAGAIRSGTSVLLACLGELIAERAGIINLGTEGSMLVGALAAFAATATLGNPYAGVLAGAVAGMLPALIHAYMVLGRRANQLATGLTVMILAQGVTSFFGRSYVSTDIRGLAALHLPLVANIPALGPVLSGHDLLTYVSMLLVPAIWYLLHRTRWGLVLRSAGEREAVVFAAGYSPLRVRCGAVLAGGFLAGLGGAQLSVAFTQNWVENITQGRGIVAVALVIFAAWSPLRALLGAYLFGGALSLQLLLQARGAGVSPFLLSMTPYVLTLLVLLAVGQRRHAMPEALQAAFESAGRWSAGLLPRVPIKKGETP